MPVVVVVVWFLFFWGEGGERGGVNKKNLEDIQSKIMNCKPSVFHLELFKSTYGHIANVEKICNSILIHLSRE